MSNPNRNKIRAIILLTVFSLNTVIGFACSVGFDMGFNSKHHHDEETTEPVVHIHKDGKKHIHYEKKNEHDHKSHHHDQASNHPKSKDDSDNCCNDDVLKFELLDKSIPHSISFVHPIFFTAFIATSASIAVFCPTGVTKDIKQFVRSYHPPIPDIRIAIQSFQI